VKDADYGSLTLLVKKVGKGLKKVQKSDKK